MENVYKNIIWPTYIIFGQQKLKWINCNILNNEISVKIPLFLNNKLFVSLNIPTYLLQSVELNGEQLILW